MWSGRVVGAVVVVIVALVVPAGSAHAAPGDPCPAAAPVDGTIDGDTVDASATDGDRNHLAGDVAGIVVDYLSPPGESLDDSIDSVVAQYGIPVEAEMTTEMIERSVLVSMRSTTQAIGCVDDDPVGFVEVELTDPRLSYTGDPIADPGGVQVDAGYVAVTTERLRTQRPVVECAVSGTVPQVPGGPPPPAGAPVVATPTFVG